MDQVNKGAVHAETDANDARVARLIADAPPGMVVDIGLIDDWLVRLGTDHEQQPPYVQSPNLNESESEKYRRESAMVAAGLASLAAGRIVDSTDVDAWIDSIGTRDERPIPRPRR
jgi:predicted transcriptional regulator